MKSRIGTILIGIGLVFLINAIFGRYLVLPGFLESLEKGLTADNLRETVPAWRIVRYLIWIFSFKLGILLTVIGASINTSMDSIRLRVFVTGGILYIIVAYVPLPGPYATFFGIGGGLITVLLLLIIKRWAEDRKKLNDIDKKTADYRMIGYFFFAMATYNLCPLLGVGSFGLKPEQMIKYGLQARAAAFASHVMIELVLGWLFIFFSYYRSNR